MARKTYTRAFKIQAVRMLNDQGLSVAEVARRLGVGENCLRAWRQAAREQGEAAFPGQGNPLPGRGGAAPPPRRGAAPPRRAGPAKKSRRLLRQPAELTFRFIAEQRGDCPVAWACAALEVSESGYHAWAAREPSRAERRRGELLAVIEQVHAEVRGRYGSPRLTAGLNGRGPACPGNTR